MPRLRLGSRAHSTIPCSRDHNSGINVGIPSPNRARRARDGRDAHGGHDGRGARGARGEWAPKLSPTLVSIPEKSQSNISLK